MTYSFVFASFRRKRLLFFALKELNTAMDFPTGTSNPNDHSLASRKKCPLANIAAHDKAIEMDRAKNMLGYLVIVITMVSNRYQNVNDDKKMLACFNELLNGKCQKQNSPDILKFWRSLQESVKRLPKSKMEMLLYSFLANILCEGMHDGVISIFKIQSIFYETCESFIQRYGTDNGADAWSKENANLKKPPPGLDTSGELQILGATGEHNSMYDQMAPYLRDEESFSSDGSMTEGGNVASDNNSPCREQLPPTLNPGNLEECEDEQAPFSTSQPSCEKTVESGGIDGHNVLDASVSKGSAATMGERTKACVVTQSRKRKTEKSGKVKSAKKVSLPPVLDTISRTFEGFGASGEHNSINTRKENPNEVSLPPVLDTISGTFEGFGASGEDNSINTRKENPNETSFFDEDIFRSDGPITERENVRGNNVSSSTERSSCETAPKMFGIDKALELNRIVDTLINQRSSSTGGHTSEETMQACGLTPSKERKTKKHGREKNPKKGSFPVEKKASLQSTNIPHSESAKTTKRPQEESKSSSEEEIPVMEGIMLDCARQKSQREHKEKKESMSREVGKKEMPFMETRASSETKGSLASDSMEANLAIEEDDCKPTKFKKPEKESSPKMLSMAMKAPDSSDPPPEISEPVQDHEFANLTTDEMDRERLRFSVPIQAPESSDPPPEISEPVQDHEFANLTTDEMDRERLRLSAAMKAPKSSDSPPEISEPVQDHELPNLTTDEMDPNRLPLSVAMQAPGSSGSAPEISKPVQDHEHAKPTTDEMDVLQAEVYKTREKLVDIQKNYRKQNGELFETRKQLGDVQYKYEIQTEKVQYLEGMNEKLMFQIQYYVSELQRYEELYYSRGSTTL